MKVFLSHALADEASAAELAKHLTKDGLEVWRASEQVLPGSNFAEEIGKALRSADAMVVLVSPDAAKSEWLQHEISFAISEPSFRNRVVPVILKASSQMPWILNRFQQIKAGADLAKAAREISKVLHSASAQLQTA